MSQQQAVKVKRIEYHENGKKALETEEIKVVEVLRVLPPDTAAAKYWLKNRQPEHWLEKPLGTNASCSGPPGRTGPDRASCTTSRAAPGA